MRHCPRIPTACALVFMSGAVLPSAVNACSLCVALGHDVHQLAALPGAELLQPISQDDPPPTFPLVVPALSSRPTASAKLYLDFDGDFTPSWGLYQPGETPAYSTDTDTATFTQTELNNIHEIWARVAEAYSPFNIDVTTIDTGNNTDRVTMRVVVGGDGKNGGSVYWPGSRAGGIGFVGGFTSVQPNTAFVFPGNLANGTPKYSAMAIAHEAGHGFGLEHQSEYNGFIKVQEYSDNDPTTTGSPQEWETPEQKAAHYSKQPTAPFMGIAYFSDRGIWFSGTSTSAFTIQDDVDVIASANNAFGYYPDEAGNDLGSASPITRISNALLAAGVITTIDDHDFYTFSTLEDSYTTLNLSVAEFGAMLDASLALYRSDGSLVDLSATSSLGESLALVLEAGSYAIDIFSAGQVGDIGTYMLTGNVGPVPEPGTAMLLLTLIPLLTHRSRRGASNRPV